MPGIMSRAIFAAFWCVTFPWLALFVGAAWLASLTFKTFAAIVLGVADGVEEFNNERDEK